jgi:hypothetical protein
MKYIHTTSDIITRGTSKDVIRPYVSNYLFSLINGLSNTNFGFNTIDKIAKDVKTFYKDLYDNEKLFVDSGGYSIIVGDVPSKLINPFMESYHYYLANYCETDCDYMFSLDIPIFLKEPEVNTYSNLHKRNYRANQLMKHTVSHNKVLYDKLVFVWQFKIAEQYEIWKNIYNEFWENDKNIKHFAIGGLVGLRGITGIKFSPFIGMLYKLLNIVCEKNLKDESILHILGVYGMHDRFHMAFLQRLFNDVYLKDSNPSIQISYDTINYFVSGLFKIRDLDSIIPIEDGKYKYGLNTEMLPYMEKIIKYPEALEEIKNNIECLIQNRPLCDTRIYCYMNVVRQLIADQIMKEVIKKYDLVNQFCDWDNFNILKNNWNSLFISLEKEYPFVFRNYTGKIMNNFKWIHSFHKWWMEGRDPIRLEKGMDMFIKNINFPKAIIDDRGK